MKYFIENYAKYFRTKLMLDIQEAFSISEAEEVVFTGHSLGGAMTQVAANDLVFSNITGNRTVKIYTYGEPRFGKTPYKQHH